MTIDRRSLLIAPVAAAALSASASAKSIKKLEKALGAPGPEAAGNTIELVDADQRPFVEVFESFPVDPDRLPQIRAALSTRPPVRGSATRPFDEIKIEESAASGFMYKPKADSEGLRPCILYIHGGGYIVGEAAGWHAYCEYLSDAVDAVVFNVEYRLAPETPFPGPLEDCYDALRWLYENAATQGVDPNRITIMGHSAGGGLTAALALLARDRGEIPIKAQVPIYPMLDFRTGTMAAPEHNPTTGEFVWTRAHNRFGWQAMRGEFDLNEKQIGYFSPTHASDLSGLPQAFIPIGALDLFLEESIHYALRLASAGVPIESQIYPGGIHGFDFIPDTPLSTRFDEDLLGALRRMI